MLGTVTCDLKYATFSRNDLKHFNSKLNTERQYLGILCYLLIKLHGSLHVLGETIKPSQCFSGRGTCSVPSSKQYRIMHCVFTRREDGIQKEKISLRIFFYYDQIYFKKVDMR